MQKIAKIKNREVKEVTIPMDELTAQRHEALFLDGDYSRIGKETGYSRMRVADYIKAGKGPASVMIAASKLYAEKEKQSDKAKAHAVVTAA